ncbi:hypothetical protein BG015_003561, partial [Linnemannia schmuckeri]
DGKDVPQEYQAAMDWYLKAAEQGHAIAQYSIGDLYYHGHGVPRDYAQAMACVGVLYDDGRGVPRDYIKAAEWYTKAADQGYELAKKDLEGLKRRGVAIK